MKHNFVRKFPPHLCFFSGSDGGAGVKRILANIGTDFLARKAFPALGVDFLGLGKSIYSARDKPGFGPRQASFVCLGRISPGLVRIFGGLLCLSRNDFPGLGANFRGPPLFV